MESQNKHHSDRRRFINQATILLSGLLFPMPSLKANPVLTAKDRDKRKEGGLADLSDIPNFCSHEHWGSIQSIGLAPEQGGFRCDAVSGAQPLNPTSIWDLLLDPYEGGWIASANPDPNKVETSRDAYYQLWKKSPEEALQKFQSLNRDFEMTGGFQCTRRGILSLYGRDLMDYRLKDWEAVDNTVQQNYADLFTWYQTAMKKANFSELIRPVHPEYYVRAESNESKKKESAFTHTILRIDPLLDLWREKSPRREALSDIAGIDPSDPKSWRTFIERLFDLAAANHSVGIKQLQAYSRNLSYLPESDDRVQFRGKLDEKSVRKFQDWVMHECCRQAHERNFIHQVHVGTNNIGESGPLPLQSLAALYPKMKMVLIHCWPFIKESGWLAKYCPNIYLDTCWLPVLNPEFLQDALNSWLNYVPVHKMMMGNDSTHVEMAVGSSLFTREILGKSLVQQQKSLKMSDAALRNVAADLLQNNAVRLYKIGEEYLRINPKN